MWIFKGLKGLKKGISSEKNENKKLMGMFNKPKESKRGGWSGSNDRIEVVMPKANVKKVSGIDVSKVEENVDVEVIESPRVVTPRLGPITVSEEDFVREGKNAYKLSVMANLTRIRMYQFQKTLSKIKPTVLEKKIAVRIVKKKKVPVKVIKKKIEHDKGNKKDVSRSELIKKNIDPKFLKKKQSEKRKSELKIQIDEINNDPNLSDEEKEKKIFELNQKIIDKNCSTELKKKDSFAKPRPKRRPPRAPPKPPQDENEVSAEKKNPEISNVTDVLVDSDSNSTVNEENEVLDISNEIGDLGDQIVVVSLPENENENEVETPKLPEPKSLDPDEFEQMSNTPITFDDDPNSKFTDSNDSTVGTSTVEKNVPVEPRVEEKVDEVKEETKPEVIEETKPEVKEETKPEVKEETKPVPVPVPEPEPEEEEEEDEDYEEQMDMIREMGFDDDDQILELLKKHKGDVSMCIAELQE